MPFIDLPLPELERYRSAVTRPADHESFWRGTLAEAAQHPLEPHFELVDCGLPLVDVFDASFAGFAGHRIHAWYIKPRGRTEGLTGIAKFIGYNGGRGFPHEHLLWAASGRAVLVMDTRGQGAGWSKGDTADPVGSEPAQSGYMTRGIGAKESYFYRRVFTDAVRAVEALRSRPEIDAQKLVALGGSQGGGITLAVAGLVPDLAAAMPDVPFLCDFPRAVAIAARDPYGEIARFLSVHRDRIGPTFETLRYFDGVNFAVSARAKALFSVGLVDDICPASTVFAAYNAYAGEKSIEIYPFNNHEGGGAFQERAQLAFLGRLGL